MKRWKNNLLLLGFVPIIIGTISSCAATTTNTLNSNSINREIYIKNLNILDSTTSEEFYNEYANDNSKLNEFFFNNISKFINYNTEQIKSNFNISIEKNENKIILNIRIFKGYWYENDILNNTKDLIGTTIIFGFKNSTNDNVDSIGGTLDGGNLLVDKYKKIIDILDLKKTINISNLTNEKILEKLKKVDEYKNVILEIGEGSSTEQGVLYLYISGSYNNQTIEKTKITVSNFINNKNYEKLKLTNIILDKNKWFNDLKPITTVDKNLISNITQDEWINKYIGYAMFTDFNGANIATLKELNEYGIAFKDFGINISKNVNIAFNGGNFQNKIFENGSWKNTNTFNITSIVNRNATFEIPTENDALEFLSSQTIINDNILSNYYPSYFDGVANYAKKNAFNYFPEIPNLITNNMKEKIESKYFKNKKISINIDFNDGSIISDDFNTRLSINIVTNIVDSSSRIISKNFEYTKGLKNLNNFFEQEKTKNNIIALLPPDENNISSKFISQLKKDNQLKTKIDSLFSNTEAINEEVNTNLQTISSFRTSILNKTYIYGDERENSEENFDNLFKKDFNKAIFNKVFYNSNSIGFSDVNSNPAILVGTGLFKYDSNNIFKLNSIRYNMDDYINKIIFIKDDNPNIINIKVPFKTIIGFNYEKTLEQDSYFSLILQKSYWTNKI